MAGVSPTSQKCPSSASRPSCWWAPRAGPARRTARGAACSPPASVMTTRLQGLGVWGRTVCSETGLRLWARSVPGGGSLCERWCKPPFSPPNEPGVQGRSRLQHLLGIGLVLHCPHLLPRSSDTRTLRGTPAVIIAILRNDHSQEDGQPPPPRCPASPDTCLSLQSPQNLPDW